MIDITVVECLDNDQNYGHNHYISTITIDTASHPDNSINQQYNIKGGSSKNIYSERIVAETPTIPKYGNYYSNQFVSI